jgi:hypothetical protein
MIRQKSAEAQEQLRRMDEYLATVEGNPNIQPIENCSTLDQ